MLPKEAQIKSEFINRKVEEVEKVYYYITIFCLFSPHVLDSFLNM
jgi:hypothetical protein